MTDRNKPPKKPRSADYYVRDARKRIRRLADVVEHGPSAEWGDIEEWLADFEIDFPWPHAEWLRAHDAFTAHPRYAALCEAFHSRFGIDLHNILQNTRRELLEKGTEGYEAPDAKSFT